MVKNHGKSHHLHDNYHNHHHSIGHGKNQGKSQHLHDTNNTHPMYYHLLCIVQGNRFFKYAIKHRNGWRLYNTLC